MPGVEGAEAVVLDASVAVRWLVEEQGSGEARALLADPVAWVAPRLLLTEVAAALRRKVGGGELQPDQARIALEGVVDAVREGEIRLAADEDVAQAALRLALLLEHKVPDCLYLALAEAEGAALATADVRLARLAEGRGVPVHLVPSA